MTLRRADNAAAELRSIGGGGRSLFGASEVWGRITGSASIGDNRWSYEWEVVTLDDSGAWVAMTTPRGSDELGLALNSIEASNGASGEQGNNVNVDTLDAGYAIAPIATGTVHRMYGTFGSAGEPRWVFSLSNGLTGGCMS